MAAMIGNYLTAISFQKVLLRKLNSWPTCNKRPCVALHAINRCRFKIKTSLSSNDKNYNLRLTKSGDGGGPPRWFSPLECGCRSKGSPLLLFLPEIDGVGHGLMLHHQRLGEIFDIWCLHIPIEDRTPLADLVKLVSSTVRSQHEHASNRPIYIVGESFGASLALIVAAQNPHIDLVLILANPATSFSKFSLQSVVPLSDMIHKHLQTGLLHAMNSTPVKLLLEITVETILWKLKMIQETQNYLDSSHLHAVKAQTLILKSGKDMLLSSITEGERLHNMLQNCEDRSFIGNGDPLFSDDSFDLVAAITHARYYRRGASFDYVSDFLPPSPSEFKMMYEPFRWMEEAFDTVMFSTMDDGKIVRGLKGIPTEGPVLLVGNHMMPPMIDSILLVSRFWIEQNIMLRTLAHPTLFSFADVVRANGGVPVSAVNLYKLLSLKSHVLLFPGAGREALHRKGEEYKLFWPVLTKFVRMAAKFGAKIVPFGGVGEDDILQLLLDGDDLMSIPPVKALIEGLNREVIRFGNDVEGEIGEQLLYFPVFLPKLPGRFYFLFGKPISTQGRDDIMRNKDKSHEMYLDVQNEIEKCIAFLKDERENDPYRNLLARLAYQSYNGFHCQIPTFDI